MVDKLIVKDFGPIRDAEMDIKKTTVLIGPQGSGKSTLAKLLKVVHANFGWAMSRLDGGNFIVKEDLSGYDLPNTYLKEETYLEAIASSKTEADRLVIQNKRIKYNAILKQNRIKIARDKNLYTEQIYIPAERVFFPMVAEAILGLLTQKVAIPNLVLEFGREYELARKSIKRLSVDYLNIEYRHEGGRDYIFFDDLGNVLLSQSASGYQSVLPMKLVIENTKEKKIGYGFIIEEPELNLYPTTQKSLIYYLADRCTKGENELMMTTHSPYVLAALNNLIFAYKVAYEKPEKAAEVEKVIPKDSWLNPDEFAAYFVADGTVRSIINPKTGLISENELDGVSDEIGDEFNALVDIYRSKTNEAIH